ncbi:MAG: NTP transferase domain-containing protein [Desulfobacteraceae bacterium]|nr:NTP transferase domain-containing protein [Desulfobacteraceae bacterium]MCF8094028.1 NTP transferase domain-containing protein [Desulfobacteraceae bacterium]
METELLKEPVAVIILAAGKGTRMKSDRAKVLHPVAGRPMILYVIDAAVRIADKDVVVVIGTQSEEVRPLVSAHADVDFVVQQHQLGTGHAAMCALPALREYVEHVVILCGDVPLITTETLNRLIHAHIRANPAVTVLGARIEDPTGYGRIKHNKEGSVERIIEEADASDEEKRINTVNTGIYCVSKEFLEAALSMVDTNNAQNEMYLTDIVGIAAEAEQKIGLVLCRDNNEMRGVNTKKDLERVEAIIRCNEKP